MQWGCWSGLHLAARWIHPVPGLINILARVKSFPTRSLIRGSTDRSDLIRQHCHGVVYLTNRIIKQEKRLHLEQIVRRSFIGANMYLYIDRL